MKILIADDHAIVREGLKRIVNQMPEVTDIIEAEDGQQVLDMITETDFDVLVLDISMPNKSGLDILMELKTSKPSLPVLILSVHPEEQYALRVLKAGASGFLHKHAAPEELKNAISKIANGSRYISESVAEKLAAGLSSKSSGAPHDILSDREFQVFRSLALGKSVSEIANELYLSAKTISTYRARIIEKTGLKNNAEIIRYALDNDLIS